MISSILRFRIYLAVAAIIIPIEYWIFTHISPRAQFPTNFLEFAYMKPESVQKFAIFEKTKMYPKLDAKIVSVGDSTGLFGLEPLIVNQYLNDSSMINMNVAGDTGFEGYRHLLRYYKNKNSKAKYAILYISPLQMPIKFPPPNKLGGMIYKNYVGLSRFVSLPNFSLRLGVTNFLYYQKYFDSLFNFNQPMVEEYPSYAQWQIWLGSSRGWLPFPKGLVHEPVDPLDEESMYGDCNLATAQGEQDALFALELERFVGLTEKLGMKAAVIFNPVFCNVITGVGSDPIQAQLDSFSAKHPEVFIPWDLITTWPVSRFGDSIHLNSKASAENSHRVGKALKSWIEDVESVNYDRGSFSSSSYHDKGIISGIVKSYDELGYLSAERSYKDGKLDGISRTYYENGQVNSERHYVKGKLDGVCKKYYPDGALEWENYFREGFQTGWSRQHYKNGGLKSICSYSQGYREGVLSFFYQNGKIQLRADYDRGKLNGLLKTYSAEGNKLTESSYRKGFLQGTTKEYYPSGRLKQESNYYKNDLDGPKRGFYESGALYQEIAFRRNDPRYVVRTFFESGHLAFQEIFEYGKSVEKRSFDRTGQLIGVEK